MSQQQQSLVLPSSIISSFLTKDLTAQLKQQRDEIDQFLQAQLLCETQEAEWVSTYYRSRGPIEAHIEALPDAIGCSGRICSAKTEGKRCRSCFHPERIVSSSSSGPVCKACRRRVASVVLLPCLAQIKTTSAQNLQYQGIPHLAQIVHLQGTENRKNRKKKWVERKWEGKKRDRGREERGRTSEVRRRCYSCIVRSSFDRVVWGLKNIGTADFN